MDWPILKISHFKQDFNGFPEIADASIFWAQIFDFRFNKIFLPKFQIHDDILAVNLVHNS